MGVRERVRALERRATRWPRWDECPRLRDPAVRARCVEVQLQLQAFPYQRFGTVGGAVKTVSTTVKGIHPGDSVVVRGTKQKDGSTKASSVTIGTGTGAGPAAATGG